jgi:hypothetical protein
MSEPVYERRTELLEAELGDELVALDAKGGNCFGFNSVATSIWRQLAGPKSFAEIREALLAEYDVTSEQCTEELRELLNSLIEKGLVQVRAVDHGRQ